MSTRAYQFDCVKVARFAREHPEWASNVRTGDIEAMEFPDEVFDVVLLNEVLEHVTDERRALAEIHRVLPSPEECSSCSPRIVSTLSKRTPFTLEVRSQTADGDSVCSVCASEARSTGL